jgi:hypothetical protein
MHLTIRVALLRDAGATRRTKKASRKLRVSWSCFELSLILSPELEDDLHRARIVAQPTS